MLVFMFMRGMILQFFFFLSFSFFLMFLTGFPGSRSASKASTYNIGNPDLIPRFGRSAGDGISCLLQYSQAPLMAKLVKNPPAMHDTFFPLKKKRLPTPVFWCGEFHGLQLMPLFGKIFSSASLIDVNSSDYTFSLCRLWCFFNSRNLSIFSKLSHPQKELSIE